MAKYEAQWTKTYVASGTILIDAGSCEKAHELVEGFIGDLTGSMQYIADRDTIEVFELTTEEAEKSTG